MWLVLRIAGGAYAAFILLFILSIETRAFQQSPDDVEFVRVRLQKQIQKIEITGQSVTVANQDHIVEPVAINSYYSKVEVSKKFFQKKLFWQVVEYRNGQLYKTQVLGAKYLAIRGQDLRSGSKALPDRLLLVGQSKFDVIGSVRFRDYLIGVVSSEMPISWPKEALKAQAIAARSYAFSIMKNRAKNSFQLESSILDQVYSPANGIQWKSARLQNVISAVDETRGMLLMKNHKVLKAYYHADCGGKTVSSASVFGTNDIQGGVVDASCPNNPKARWQYKISKKSLGQKVAQFFHSPEGLIPLHQVIALESSRDKKTADSRIPAVIFSYENGLERKVASNQLRDILGYQDLKSTQFEIQEKGSDYIFKGVGFGHGVGLCQWGSRALAQAGKTFDQILRHYYPEAGLSKLSLKTAENLHSEEADRYDNHHVF